MLVTAIVAHWMILSLMIRSANVAGIIIVVCIFGSFRLVGTVIVRLTMLSAADRAFGMVFRGMSLNIAVTASRMLV